MKTVEELLTSLDERLGSMGKLINSKIQHPRWTNTRVPSQGENAVHEFMSKFSYFYLFRKDERVGSLRDTAIAKYLYCDTDSEELQIKIRKFHDTSGIRVATTDAPERIRLKRIVIRVFMESDYFDDSIDEQEFLAFADRYVGGMIVYQKFDRCIFLDGLEACFVFMLHFDAIRHVVYQHLGRGWYSEYLLYWDKVNYVLDCQYTEEKDKYLYRTTYDIGGVNCSSADSPKCRSLAYGYRCNDDPSKELIPLTNQKYPDPRYYPQQYSSRVPISQPVRR